MNEDKFNIKDIIAAILCLIIAIVLFSMGLKYRLKKDEKVSLEQIELRMGQMEINMEKLYCLVGQYILESHNSEGLSDSALKCLLDSVGAYYPEVIMAQYELESCKGQSKVYCRTNNLFGMKKAYKRQTCRNTTNIKAGYAEYKNWQLSVLDRILWDISKWSEKPTKQEYLSMLGRTYAEDPQYIEKLKVISEKYK